MSKFLDDADDDTKAIAIPWVFSENSRAEREKMQIEFVFFFTVFSSFQKLNPIITLLCCIELFTKRQYFGLAQIQSILQQINKCDSKKLKLKNY